MAVFNGSVNDIESKLNKTNSISENPSDEKYPSEKAVKDYVDDNAGGGGDFEAALNTWVEEYLPESKMDKVSELEVGSEDYYPNCMAVKNYVDGQIGDIETALDRIIEIQEQLIGGSGTQEITFTIDGLTFTAEKGMTWAEWCDSEYNTIEAYVNEDSERIYYVSGGDEWELRDSSDADVIGQDEIIADKSYMGIQ